MTASPDHGKLDYVLQGIHTPFQWTYADQAARLAAGGFLVTDQYKLALQLDDNSVWILLDDSPVTWSAFGGGAGGLLADWKASVRAATTVNITLSGLQTIDGVVLVAGDRVLVKNQTTGAENGIYTAASGAWLRATDADVSAEVTPGMAVVVEEGTALADTAWFLATNAPITLGTTSLSFSLLATTGSGANTRLALWSGTYTLTSDAGLTFTGGVLTDTGGINVGSATGAGVGEIRVSDQFSALVNGSGGGFFAGTALDVSWYRSAADIWGTLDSVDIGGRLTLGGAASTSSGTIDTTQKDSTTGVPDPAVLIRGGVHTAITASSEAIDIDLVLDRIVQHSTGALATQRAFVVRAPTYSFVGASTITTAAALAITGAPIAGTNATITTALALWIQSGASLFAGSISTSAGINVGTASGAATGQIKASADFSSVVDGITGGGFFAGASLDVQWYRHGPNVWRTPDSVIVDTGLNVGNTSGATAGEIRSSSMVRTNGQFTTAMKMHSLDSVGDTGSAQIFEAGDTGFVAVVDETDRTCAIFFIRGSGGTQEVSDPSGVFSNTQGTVSSTNVYWNAGQSQHYLENKRGATHSYRLAFLGDT